ncbi:hypothetical protein, partial [Klebsiella pneumoniae]
GTEETRIALRKNNLGIVRTKVHNKERYSPENKRKEIVRGKRCETGGTGMGGVLSLKIKKER